MFTIYIMLDNVTSFDQLSLNGIFNVLVLPFNLLSTYHFLNQAVPWSNVLDTRSMDQTQISALEFPQVELDSSLKRS